MNTEAELTPLQKRSSKACQQDAIFLLQARHWILTGYPVCWDGEYSWDPDYEGVVLGDTDSTGLWRPREDQEPLTNDELKEMEAGDGIPCVIETWETVNVFLTREEADAFGELHSYRYPDGWRSYAISAKGQLVDAIRFAPVEDEGGE